MDQPPPDPVVSDFVAFLDAMEREHPGKRFLKALLPAGVLLVAAFLFFSHVGPKDLFPASWLYDKPIVAVDGPSGDVEFAESAGPSPFMEWVIEMPRFWGPVGWTFPAVCFLILGISRRRRMRWLCDGAILAWIAWISRGSHHWPEIGSILLPPVIAAWIWIASRSTWEGERATLRLLIPGGFVVAMSSLYSALNYGALSPQLGGAWTNNITARVALGVWLCAWACAPFVSAGLRTRWRVVHFLAAGVATFWMAWMSITTWMALDLNRGPLIDVQAISALVYVHLFFALLLVYAAIAFGFLITREPANERALRRPRPALASPRH